MKKEGELPAKIQAQIEELSRDTSSTGVGRIDPENLTNLGQNLIETICRWRDEGGAALETWVDSPAQIISNHQDNPEVLDRIYETAIQETLEELEDQDDALPNSLADANQTINRLNQQLEKVTTDHHELQRDYDLLKEGQEHVLKDLSQTLDDKETMENQLAALQTQLEGYHQLKIQLNSMETEVQRLNKNLRDTRAEKEKLELEKAKSRLEGFGRPPLAPPIQTPRMKALEDSKQKLQQLSVKELEKVSQYSGEDGRLTISEYWRRLEHLIEAAFEMPEDEDEQRCLKANVLLTKITDPARSHLDSNLGSEQKNDYKEIIKELERRYEYGRDEYYYKNQLASLPGEGKLPFVELVGKIETLAKNLVKVTMKGVEEDSYTYQTVYESYAKQWLEEKMPKPHLQCIKMQTRNLSYQNLKEEGARMEEVFRSRKPTRLNQMEELIYEAVAGEPSPKPTAECKHCKKSGHSEVNCWIKNPEKRPKTPRTPTADPRPSNRNVDEGRRPKCHFCGRTGHVLRDCRQLAKYSKLANEEREKQASLKCDRCKRRGHDASQCRERSPPSNSNSQPQGQGPPANQHTSA